MPQARRSIVCPCYHGRSQEGEQFIPEHVLSLQLAGTLTTFNGVRQQVFRTGDLRFGQRNCLHLQARF